MYANSTKDYWLAPPVCLFGVRYKLCYSVKNYIVLEAKMDGKPMLIVRESPDVSSGNARFERISRMLGRPDLMVELDYDSK